MSTNTPMPGYWHASYHRYGQTVIRSNSRPSQKTCRDIFDCAGRVDIRRATADDVDSVLAMGGWIQGADIDRARADLQKAKAKATP